MSRPDEWALLSRMEAACRQTRCHLDLIESQIVIERQIDGRAARLINTLRSKGRSFARHGPKWSLEDEPLLRAQIEQLTFERRGEIDALPRKLARQERAIAAFCQRHYRHRSRAA